METSASGAGQATPPSGAWADLLAEPRHPNAALQRRDIPGGSGVYAWFVGEDCVYVGKAKSLRSRLSSHRARSADLSRSTLRASVAVRELGVTRAQARRRPSVMSPEDVSVINAWFERVDVAWVQCDDVRAADALEQRLRRDWLPPLNLR